MKWREQTDKQRGRRAPEGSNFKPEINENSRKLAEQIDRTKY
jgi:hypothetical protein